MRLLIISHDATRTGAPILLLNLARAIVSKQEIKIEFLLKRGGVLEVEFRKFGKVEILKRGRVLQGFYKKRLTKYILSFDLIISNTITNGDLDFILKKHPKVYTYVHELPQAIQYFTKPELVEKVLSHTKIFLYPSEAVRNSLIDQFNIPVSNLKHLPYIIPDKFEQYREKRTDIRESLGIANGEVLVMGLGTGDWRKAPDLFFQALSIAKTYNSNIKGLWVGFDNSTVEYRRILYEIEKYGLNDSVKIEESTNDPFNRLIAADIFLLSSREDPYPLVVLEAAMMGLPVICFIESGGAIEFIGNDSGIGVPFGRTDLAAKAISDLANDINGRIRLGKCAKEKFLKRHSDSEVINIFYEILDITK